MAKAHLRSKIAGLEDEHKHTVESFDEARAKYLKELVVLRDQVRARDGHYLAAIHKVVHEEEPVIYYEPMKYLEETTRAHVVDIVEEKLKQLIATLKDLPYIPPERKVEQSEEEPLTPIISKPKREPRSRKPSDDMQGGAALAAAEAAVGRVTKMLEESQARTEHLEKALKKLQQEYAAVEADLVTLMAAAQEEYEDVSGILDSHGGIKLQPPPQDLASPEAGAVPNPERNKLRSQYINEIFIAEKHIRKSLLARLEEAQEMQMQRSRDGNSLSMEMQSTWSRPVIATAASLGDTSKADHDLELREALSRNAQAEERARIAEKDRANLRSELLQAQSRLAEEVEARQAADTELASAKQRIKELEDEIEKLRALLDELGKDDGKTKERLKSVGLNWRKPTKKVFERLFQDSIDRRERKITLITSIEQAREEHALEIFKGSILPYSNYDCSGFLDAMDSYDEASSCGRDISRAHTDGWLIDRSQKAGSSHNRTYERSTSAAARMSSPSLDDSVLHSPSTPTCQAGKIRGRERNQSSSPSRSVSPDTKLGIEGTHVGPRSRSNSPDEAGFKAAEEAVSSGLGVSSGFAAAMGLSSKTGTVDGQLSEAEISRLPLRTRSPKGSRPSSAGSGHALRKAKATITARPRSAALPAIQRRQRPPTETSLLKEAQRLLAAPTNPTAQLGGRSTSAPSLRDANLGRARRPQSGFH
jgi:archaellum component FlaC